LHPSIAVSLATGLLLAACGSRGQEGTPTLSVEQIRTEAVGTFAAGLTSTALAMPTHTPGETASPTLLATESPAVTSTSAPPVPSFNPTTSCYGLTFVSDVTVPDNSDMTAGQKFTKTWRVRNSGSCTWQTGFRLTFSGGEAMGGSSVLLSNEIQTGDEVELSVDLTAPGPAGTYRGNWRMATGSGTLFGDEIYVLIKVGTSTEAPTQSASATATHAATATATVTPTPTETVAP
jgi:hypothetical protein